MRAGCAALLVILGLAAGTSLGADVSAAHDLIARCAHEADPSVRGLDAFRTRCPGIGQALFDLGLEPLLPAGWQAELSPRALRDFDALASQYAAPLSQRATQPDDFRLQSIALSLKPPPSPISWWERLRAWIRNWFEPVSANPPAWLRFLSRLHIGARTWIVTFVILAAAVVMAVGAIVVIELRAAGAGSAGRRRSRPGRASAGGDGSIADNSPDLADLESAPVRDRPVLLLRALVGALRRAHRLQGDRELTCRELITQARFDTARQRDDFRRVALLAERALYGGRQAAPSVIPEEVLRSARLLHEQLLALPKAAEGG